MKSSGGKIIIKPRLVRQTTSPNAAPSTASHAVSPAARTLPDQMEGEQEDGSDNAENATAEPAHSATTSRSSEPEANEERDADAGLAGEDEAGEPAATGPTVARPRGRGRGRGRGDASVPSIRRPRGRPPGSGRGKTSRGRGTRGGGGLTIRLPKLGGGDDMQVDAEGSVSAPPSVAPGAADGAGDEGTPAAEVEEVEKEKPLGGGKPFRKIQGKVYVIENDEFITDDDPIGDTKIDMYGNLLGGRRFKASTFILPQRHPQRVYMLAIDAARTSGFRDSLYYFRRNALAFKLNATQFEKEYLIEKGKLGSHLRTRSVTLVTARSAFKLHGSKTIADGRWVVDDYYESKVLEEITAKGLKAGDPVGELPDPQMPSNEAAALAAAQPKPERLGSGLGVYRAGGPTTIFGGTGLGPYSDGPHNAVRKSMLNREGLNEENWMFVAAQRTCEAGAEWAKKRKEALRAGENAVSGKEKEREEKALDRDAAAVPDAGVEEMQDTKKEKNKKKMKMAWMAHPLGVYEPHTGLVHFRADTQPTRSRWAALPDSTEKRRVLGGTKTGNGAWGLAWVDTVMEPREGEEMDEGREEREALMRTVGGSV